MLDPFGIHALSELSIRKSSHVQSWHFQNRSRAKLICQPLQCFSLKFEPGFSRPLTTAQAQQGIAPFACPRVSAPCGGVAHLPRNTRYFAYWAYGSTSCQDCCEEQKLLAGIEAVPAGKSVCRYCAYFHTQFPGFITAITVRKKSTVMPVYPHNACCCQPWGHVSNVITLILMRHCLEL